MNRHVRDRFPLALTTSRRDSSGSAAMKLSDVLLVLAGAIPALAFAAGAHGQTGFGRLFSTPEQRAELDRMRRDAESVGVPMPVPADTGTSPGPSQESEEAPRLGAVTIDGIVIRRDGHGIAWVNGERAAIGTTTPEGVRVGALLARQGHVRIRIPGERGSVDLEPGQTIVVESGRVLDAYQDRRIARRVTASPGLAANPVPDYGPDALDRSRTADDATQ